MAMDTDTAAALLAERGPAPASPAQWRNASGGDLLFERPDLGPGCHTLVPAGELIPEPLRGLPCRERDSGKRVRLNTWPAPGHPAYPRFLELVRERMAEHGVDSHDDLPGEVLDGCAEQAKAETKAAKGGKR